VATSIHRRGRWALAGAGVASWLGGAVATFVSSNGPGTVALVVVGAAASILALIGRWPSRVVVSGNEVVWEEIYETIDSQAAAARYDTGKFAELVTLRRRLQALELTGDVPEHPAAAYDRAVHEALLRVVPGAQVFVEPTRSRERADFVLRRDPRAVAVETKWRAEIGEPFRGSTLAELTGRLDPAARVLVVSNAHDITPAGQQLHALVGPRGRVVSWRSAEDDARLAAALDALLQD
jgi:hypothetical protein